jgi:hypothetical protein
MPGVFVAEAVKHILYVGCATGVVVALYGSFGRPSASEVTLAKLFE